MKLQTVNIVSPLFLGIDSEEHCTPKFWNIENQNNYLGNNYMFVVELSFCTLYRYNACVGFIKS